MELNAKAFTLNNQSALQTAFKIHPNTIRLFLNNIGFIRKNYFRGLKYYLTSVSQERLCKIYAKF